MGGIFPWSFCICPNAGSAITHIGHIWSFTHSRWLYQLASSLANDHPGAVDLKWNMALDYGFTLEGEAAYVALLKWMGMPVDEVHHTGDYFRLSNTGAPRSSGYPFIARLCGMAPWIKPCEQLGQAHLYKLLYFNAQHAYWHMRGLEHARSQLGIVEEVASQYLHPLRYPIMFYHPMLNDEKSVKISASTPNEPYVLTPEVLKLDSVTVLKAILKAMGRKPVEITVPCPKDKEMVAQIAQFYGCEAGRYYHRLIAEDLRVPANWADSLK